MSDLIDRQAALEAILNCSDIFVNNKPVMIDKVDAQEALVELPTAEPKKGKWELKEDILSWEGTFDGYFCSECGKGFLNDLCCNNGADWVDVQKDFKFCPFCGADMRGEE